MKNNILYLVLSFIILSFAGCSNFLDVQPEGNPTTNNYFVNDAQTENAIKVLYAVLYNGDNGYGREIFWEQCAANFMVAGRTRSFNSLLTLTPNGDESPLRDNYNMLTSQMARSNWVVKSLLDKEKETTLTAVEKRSLGEAFFIRGFVHFVLAYRYGSGSQGVPAIKYEEFDGNYDYSIPTQQATVMDNYSMVISDFEKAESYLPAFESYGPDERGRAHKAAAVAMMSRVYAYWATWDKTKWDNVISSVDKLQNTYSRDLTASYTSLFSTDWTNDWWSSEYCFSFPSNGGTDWKRGGTEWPGVILENKGWGEFNGWGQFKPSLDIYNELLKDGEGNERLVTSILEYGQEFQFNGNTRRFYSASDIETGFQINKWMQAFAPKDFVENGYVNYSGDWPTTRCNFHVIRFADCMLLRAEANLVKGNNEAAARDLNKIRERVGLSGNSTGTWAELYHERLCELIFEPASDLFADLKRWAVSGEPEIKALAIAALEKHPDARYYADRSNPDSDFTIGPYLDYQSPVKKWEDHKICFPYPSSEIIKSGGLLKQNPGY